MTTPENPDTIWVQSDLLTDGTYVAAIHYDTDQSRILDRETGMAYAAEIFTAATYAEYDAAVIRQLTTAGVSRQAAARTIGDLRADRPPLDYTATAPLRLIPGVAAKTGHGFLRVDINGRPVGQWDPADARDHASNILSVLATVDLDAAYRRYLIGSLGLDRARAENVVGDLATHIH